MNTIFKTLLPRFRNSIFIIVCSTFYLSAQNTPNEDNFLSLKDSKYTYGIVIGGAIDSYALINQPMGSTPNGFKSTIPFRLGGYITFPMVLDEIYLSISISGSKKGYGYTNPKYKHHYLFFEFPVELNVKVVDKLYVITGFSTYFKLWETKPTEETYDYFHYTRRNQYFGLTFGARYSLSRKVGLSIMYSRAISDLSLYHIKDIVPEFFPALQYFSPSMRINSLNINISYRLF
jgi:hypothetical protein